MMVLPPSSRVASVNAICGAVLPATGSRRIWAFAMVWAFTGACMTSALVAAGIDDVERRAQVCCQHRLRALDVTSDDTIGQQLVRADELLAAVERAHHHAAVTIGLVIEIGMRSDQAFGAAGRQQSGMET